MQIELYISKHIRLKCKWTKKSIRRVVDETKKKNSQEEDCSKIVKIQQYEPTGVKPFALFAQFNIGLEMEPLVKLSLARNDMQYFVATYMYLDLPWEKPDTTTLSFLLQLTGYLIWQKLLSFCLKLMILLFVRQFAVGWFPKFATDKWPFSDTF